MAQLSVRKMAELLGVSKSQVDRDRQRGMPMGDAEAARAWRLANVELARAADSRIDRPQAPARDMQPGAEGGTAAVPGPDTSSGPGSSEEDDQVDESTQAYRADRARNERIKADRAELELQQLRGDLVSAREVEQLQFTAGRIVRDRIEMVPARAAADLRALVLMAVPEAQRDVVAAGLDLSAFQRRLAELLREALSEASKAIEEDRRGDDETD